MKSQEKIGKTFRCIIDRKEGNYFVGRTEFDSPDVDNEVLVDAAQHYVKVGDSVEAKIIAIDKDRLSLSMKQLSEDPWMTEVDQFKAGDTVEGTVTRITPFGAFVQISPAVEALVHVSELGGDGADPEKVFTLNERKEFVVLDIDKDNRKISLSLTGAKKK